MRTTLLALLSVKCDSDYRVGTAYAVGPDLILTSAHVVLYGKDGVLGQSVQVCFLDDQESWQDAELPPVWASTELDVCLLRLASHRPGWSETAWGRFDRVDRVPWESAGFPRAARMDIGPTPGIRDTADVRGSILPRSGLRQQRYELTVDAAASVEEWSGISGAPVFSCGFLVGVVCVAAFGGQRLWATPVERLLDDPVFFELVGSPDVGVASGLDTDLAGDVPLKLPESLPHSPAAFIQRVALESQVINQLRDSLRKPATIALVGPPGNGKTTIAATCARTVAEQVDSSDLVLWGALGQQPDHLSLAYQWLYRLGDGQRTTSLSDAILRLDHALRGRQAIIVLDDVWTPDAAEPFTGGLGVPVLLTTRFRSVAERVDAMIVEVPPFELDEAMTYFAERLNQRLPESDRSMLQDIAREVGCVPLALRLMASRISAGASPRQILEAFRGGKTAFDLLAAQQSKLRGDSGLLNRAFQLSFDFLRAESESSYHALLLLSILREDALFSAQTCARLCAISASQAELIFQELVSASLLDPAGTHELGNVHCPLYRLHDLVRDYAAHLLGATPPSGFDTVASSIHAVFLTNLRSELPDPSAWASLQGDGYSERHLGYHLTRAGDAAGLYHLLTQIDHCGRNAWFIRCYSHGMPEVFATDVDSADHLFDSEPFPESGYFHRIGLIPLIRASTSSRLAKSDSGLLAASVLLGVVDMRQAVFLASQIADVNHRIDVLLELLRIAHQEIRPTIVEGIRSCLMTGIHDSGWASSLKEVVKFMQPRDIRSFCAAVIDVSASWEVTPLVGDRLGHGLLGLLTYAADDQVNVLCNRILRIAEELHTDSRIRILNQQNKSAADLLLALANHSRCDRTLFPAIGSLISRLWIDVGNPSAFLELTVKLIDSELPVDKKLACRILESILKQTERQGSNWAIAGEYVRSSDLAAAYISAGRQAGWLRRRSHLRHAVEVLANERDNEFSASQQLQAIQDLVQHPSNSKADRERLRQHARELIEAQAPSYRLCYRIRHWAIVGVEDPALLVKDIREYMSQADTFSAWYALESIGTSDHPHAQTLVDAFFRALGELDTQESQLLWAHVMIHKYTSSEKFARHVDPERIRRFALDLLTKASEIGESDPNSLADLVLAAKPEAPAPALVASVRDAFHSAFHINDVGWQLICTAKLLSRAPILELAQANAAAFLREQFAKVQEKQALTDFLIEPYGRACIKVGYKDWADLVLSAIRAQSGSDKRRDLLRHIEALLKFPLSIEMRREISVDVMHAWEAAQASPYHGLSRDFTDAWQCAKILVMLSESGSASEESWAAPLRYALGRPWHDHGELVSRIYRLIGIEAAAPLIIRTFDELRTRLDDWHSAVTCCRIRAEFPNILNFIDLQKLVGEVAMRNQKPWSRTTLLEAMVLSKGADRTSVGSLALNWIGESESTQDKIKLGSEAWGLLSDAEKEALARKWVTNVPSGDLLSHDIPVEMLRTGFQLHPASKSNWVRAALESKDAILQINVAEACGTPDDVIELASTALIDIANFIDDPSSSHHDGVSANWDWTEPQLDRLADLISVLPRDSVIRFGKEFSIHLKDRSRICVLRLIGPIGGAIASHTNGAFTEPFFADIRRTWEWWP